MKQIEQIVQDIARYIDDKKGEDIVIIDLRGKSPIADFFVIATGRNNRHTAALAQHVEDEVYKEIGLDVHHKEGHRAGEWVVLDYRDIIVHLFNPEKRVYYHLDKLWQA